MESEFTFESITGFKTSAQRLESEKETRREDNGNLIRITNPLIGSLTNGIFPDELFVIGAAPGTGKTQLLKEIAYEAARNGRKVGAFCLEADIAEWESREKYEILVELYRKDGGTEVFDREDWRSGDVDFLDKYEDQADELMLKNGASNIYTYYRTGDFTVDEFKRAFLAASNVCDVFLVDHLQMVSYEREDSKRETEELLMLMRKLASTCRKGIVLVSHLRKRQQSANFQKLVPGFEEFLGTMAIGGLATKCLMLSSGGYNKETKNFITYAKLQKSRGANARTATVVKIEYDVTAERYLPETVEYGFAKAVGNKEVFQAYNKTEVPHYVARLIGG